MLRPIFDPGSVLASTLSSTASAVGSTVTEVGSAIRGLANSVVFIPTGPIVVPLPLLPVWPFRSATRVAPQLGIAERTNRVSSILVSPHKYVGYIADSVTFVAMGTGSVNPLTAPSSRGNLPTRAN